ncbi:MAG: HEPN domain-containing protein, partial [Candidatus Methanofastidiosia archaeon]
MSDPDLKPKSVEKKMTEKGKARNEKSMEMARSYLNRAGNKINEAREHLKYIRYSESISASQECIELSIKSAFFGSSRRIPKKT